MHAPRPPAVVFEDVTCRFGPVAAVDGVSFTVRQGELLTLLGPSGCGKTTTLRLVAGLELPSSGRIVIGGEDVTALSASQRDVAMVFQSYALYPHMSVAENVGYGLRMSGLRARERAERAAAALDLVGLSGLGGRMPSELSGGQQQRVAVARAVVLEPDVLLFDEPLSNLDAKLRRRMRDEIRDLQQRLGLTVVYVTHDQEEALAISDTVIVMDEGRIAQEGTPRDLYERPVSAFVADFIGAANLVPAEVLSVEAGRARVALGPVTLEIGDPDVTPGPASVVIRPHALVPAAEGDAGALAATVVRGAYLGARLELELDTALGRLNAVADAGAALPARGAMMFFRIREDGLAVLPPVSEGDPVPGPRAEPADHAPLSASTRAA